jgi:hypothetical protein
MMKALRPAYAAFVVVAVVAQIFLL